MTGSASEAIAGAARAFLDSLSTEQRDVVAHEFDDTRRFDWHYVPKQDRKGLPLKQMTADQAAAANRLLRTALSASGYEKTREIMQLEIVLAEIENAYGYRDPEKYFLSFFGTPEPGADWAMSFEGHHVSLNFTVLDGKVAASSPTFLGANPHRVSTGTHAGLRVLGAEEDRGRRLLESLDERQRAIAVIAANAPADIFSGAKPRIRPAEPEGLAAAAMNAGQRELLRALIDEYADNVAGAAAAKRRAQIEAAGDTIHFAWMGSATPGDPHYYRVQTPTFLIEYDNVQNGANHSHTVWRDFDGDFGRDLIAEHRAAHQH
jgi:hypothetical protein